MNFFAAAVVAVLAGLLAAEPVMAAVLKVGPGEALAVPSQAARVAGDGDTVAIAPGEYYDCAVWRQDRLTIAGPDDPATPAVLTDTTCQGKAVFVVGGRGVTIRRLTFARARVPDGNGAGIRAEGADLTVADSRFVDNQSAILVADGVAGTLAIADSTFERNGAMRGESCVATLHAAAVAVLRIERSAFLATRACDVVRAAAARVEVLDSRFDDGADGASQRMLAVGGGSLLVRGSRFARGPHSAPPDIAIARRHLWGDGGALEVRDTTLANATGRPAVLVHNLAGGPVRLGGNRVGAGDVELDDSGLWLARARSLARAAVDDARALAGRAKRAVWRALPF
ncbi:MAG: hypothetical protein IT555_12220 [Acetobacteraceae bacterium]|nr:hypothetical protein [Acetobacteraceae bacterium]